MCCGGDAVVDDCGVCDGGNADMDCAGVCNGTSELDDCGVCNGGNANQDCWGACFGISVEDCNGDCDGTAVEDECGVCGGDGMVNGCCEGTDGSADCTGECGGSAVVDECGICNGSGATFLCSDESTYACDVSGCPFVPILTLASYLDFGTTTIENNDTVTLVLPPAAYDQGHSTKILAKIYDPDSNVADLSIAVDITVWPYEYFNPFTAIDADENVYETVVIGDQVWMAENLKTTHYNNGDWITYPSNEDFGSRDVGQMGIPTCDLDSIANQDPCTNLVNADIYGNLYNWAVTQDDRGVCPEGFHVPSLEEFEIMRDFVGGENAAGAVKEVGFQHWLDPNTDATNSSGFTALPAGYRYGTIFDATYKGHYYWFERGAYWWTTDGRNSSTAWNMDVHYDDNSYRTQFDRKEDGRSIRCIYDTPFSEAVGADISANYNITEDSFTINIGNIQDNGGGSYVSIIEIIPTAGSEGMAQIDLVVTDQSGLVDASFFVLDIELETELEKITGCRHPLAVLGGQFDMTPTAEDHWYFNELHNIPGPCQWPVNGFLGITQAYFNVVDNLTTIDREVAPLTLTRAFDEHVGYYQRFFDTDSLNTELIEIGFEVAGNVGGSLPCGEGYSVLSPGQAWVWNQIRYGSHESSRRTVTTELQWHNYTIPIEMHYGTPNVIKITFENNVPQFDDECGNRVLYVNRFRLRQHGATDWVTFDTDNPPDNVTVEYWIVDEENNTYISSDGMMLGDGSMEFKIWPEYFLDNNLWSAGLPLEETISLPTEPTYGIIALDAASSEDPFDYTGVTTWDGGGIPVNTVDTEIYDFDYVSNTDLNALYSDVENPWPYFCQPFNEYLDESFTFKYELTTYYNVGGLSQEIKKWDPTVVTNTYLNNNHEDYSCNNFYIEAEKFDL